VKKTITILFSSAFLFGMAQGTSNLHKLESDLDTKFKELRKESVDREKIYFSEQIANYLRKNLNQPGIVDYNFTKLNSVSTLKSPDGKFRIINWNIEMSDLSHQYFCFLIKKKGNSNSYDIIEFKDKSMNMFEPHPQKTLTSSNWFGCLYYKIVPVKKGAKTIYTMLAYDGNNDRSNIKFIEGMIFSGRKVKLGVPIIETKEGIQKRYFLEHSEKTIISLNHDPQRNMIVMDHLVPENDKLKGMYEFYVPCFSYDGFKFINGKWVLEEDVVAVNKPKEKNLKVQITEDKFVTIKNKWEDPTNGGETGTHVAITPEQAEKQKKKKKNYNDKKLKFKKAKYLDKKNQRSIIYGQ
jgi:hypothetical protein